MNNSVEIVIVLYKTALQESLTYQSFFKNIINSKINYELVIYNNSPEISIVASEQTIVVNSAGNDMLAGAYNYALRRAIETKRKWLLLLDQDTELTEAYFDEIKQFMDSNTDEDIVAVVPSLFKGNLHLSPVSYNPKLGPFYFFKSIDKIDLKSNQCITAFNSATMLSVSFMESIGGFSIAYPLDMLDHWYFYLIYKKDKKVFILNTRLEQNLSLLDMDKSMNLIRYRGYLRSLKQFSNELKFPANFFLNLRLIHSLISQLIRPGNRKYFKLTLRAFLNIKKV